MLNMFRATHRPKHVEQLRNTGIINSTTRSHLVGSFYRLVWRLATGLTVRRSNPGGGWGGARFSPLVQTGSGSEPASCTVRTGHFTLYVSLNVNYAYPKNRIWDILYVSNSAFHLHTNLYV